MNKIPDSNMVFTIEESIYLDHVVGPFAGMVWKLCMTLSDADPTAKGKTADRCYKEIYNLLLRGKAKRWW